MLHNDARYAGFPINDVGNDRKCISAPLLAFPAPLLSFPQFLAGIHGRAWRPRILVIEEPVARLDTASRGAACYRGSKGPSPRPSPTGRGREQEAFSHLRWHTPPPALDSR